MSFPKIQAAGSKVGALLFFFFLMIYPVWTQPQPSQAQGGVESLHRGKEGQIKQGGLLLGNDSSVKYGLLVRNGKVGIGTLSPSEKLTVNGIIESTLGGFKFPDGTMQKTAASGVTSNWGESGGNVYRLQGKVGIGTSTPTALLDVLGTVHALGFNCTDCIKNDGIAADAVGAEEIAIESVGSSELAATGVTAGIYGDTSNVPQITVDDDGRITSVASVPVSVSPAPTASAQGGSVMYLKKAIVSVVAEPAACPAGWSEADLQQEYVGNGEKNVVRSCYRTDKACTAMYLKRAITTVAGEPLQCPTGWTEADLQKESVGHSYLNHVRTCYRCP